MGKLSSLFSRSKSSQPEQTKPLDSEPHESEAQKTEGPSDAEAAKIDEVSNVFTGYLQKLWKYLLKYEVGDDQKLGLEDIVNLGIRYGTLDVDGMDGGEAQESISLCASAHVDDTSEFFQPMNLEEFSTYSIDMENADTRRFAKEYLCSWVQRIAKGGNETEYDKEYEYDIDSAGELCTLLAVSFECLKMKSSESEQSKYFQALTVWRETDDPFHYGTCDMSWFWASRPDMSAPETVWAAENKPHMMVTIANVHDADDDSLLVNEIRVIISLMTIRLLNNSFRDENIAPVQAFSFTCSRQGRILQAHMNDNGLMIRRSRLFAFSGSRDAPLNLFLRHMVASLQGSTRILNDPQIDYDFSRNSRDL